MNKNSWVVLGNALFGGNWRGWPFRCPKCGHVATMEDFKRARAPMIEQALFMCLGCFKRGLGCSFTADSRTPEADGLIRVDDQWVFPFYLPNGATIKRVAPRRTHSTELSFSTIDEVRDYKKSNEKTIIHPGSSKHRGKKTVFDTET